MKKKNAEPNQNKTGFRHTVNRNNQAEASPDESEEKYRTIFENIHEGYFEVDLAGNYTSFSEAVCKIHGYPREELMGMNNRQSTDPETSKKVFQAFHDVFKTGKPLKSFDWPMSRKDGSQGFIEASVALKVDSAGKPTGFRGFLRDITERKQIEDALKKSEENFRRSLDDSPLGIRISTMEGETIYANKAILDVYGRDRIEELKNMTVKERYTPQSYAAYQIRKEQRLRGEAGPSEYEVSIVRKNGDVRHLQVFRKEIFWNGKKQSQVIYNDITERKTAEELVRKSENLYRLIADNIKDYVWFMGLGLKWIYISPSGEKLLGYTLKELQQLPMDNFLTETSFQLAMDTLSAELSRFSATPPSPSHKVSLELETRCKDGKILCIESTLSFLTDKDGKPLALLGEGRDITDRKKAEEKLRQSEQKYRSILERIQEGYFEVDRAGNFTFFNDSLCRMTGCRKEELLGMNYRQFSDQENSQKVFQAFNRVYKTGKPTEAFDWQIQRKDGTLRYIEASVSLQKDSSDQPTGFNGIIRDITERRKIEDELWLNTKL